MLRWGGVESHKLGYISILHTLKLSVGRNVTIFLFEGR